MKGICVLERVEIIHKSKFLPGTVEKNSSGRNRTYACAMPVNIYDTGEYTLQKNYPHRVKCHKIIMIYPQPVRRHYHPKYTSITLAPVSYLRSLVVRAVHRHRTGVGSIPAGGPYS